MYMIPHIYYYQYICVVGKIDIGKVISTTVRPYHIMLYVYIYIYVFTLYIMYNICIIYNIYSIYNICNTYNINYIMPAYLYFIGLYKISFPVWVSLKPG